MEQLDFAGMIASRIFHDFAGPIGALTNGSELLADENDPAVRAEFTAMLGLAAGKLAARLKLYRLIFGAGALADPIASDDARVALSDWLDMETHIALDWRIAGGTRARGEAKLALALAVLAVEAMPRGGALVVAVDGSSWSVEAVGARAALTADVLAVLAGEVATDAESRAAVALFACALATRLGLQLVIGVEENRVKLMARAE